MRAVGRRYGSTQRHTRTEVSGQGREHRAGDVDPPAVVGIWTGSTTWVPARLLQRHARSDGAAGISNTGSRRASAGRTPSAPSTSGSSATTDKYPKATAWLTRDRDELLAFYNFPAVHWTHLRTTNVIESALAQAALASHASA